MHVMRILCVCTLPQCIRRNDGIPRKTDLSAKMLFSFCNRTYNPKGLKIENEQQQLHSFLLLL